jgi:cholesterol oxidase
MIFNHKGWVMNRRNFLKGAAATGAAAMSTLAAPLSAKAGGLLDPLNLFPTNYQLLVPEIFANLKRPPSYVPALVIGSGFGGAISAYRLAQAGIKTAVLERGSRWPMDPWRTIHPNDFNPDGRNYWFRDKATLQSGLTYKLDRFAGILDTTDYKNISVWRGACVGGGSKVFTGVMIEPQQKYFEAIFGSTVNYREMHEIYYPKVRNMLKLSTMPSNIYNHASFGHSRIWDQQVRAAGYSPKAIDGIWNWDVVNKEINLQSRPSATIGESNHGNSNGAKFDLNQNYLKYAEQTGNVSIYSGMQVTAISKDPKGQYLVKVNQIDPYGKLLASFTVACDRLFLAAGSIGTSELLVKARQTGELGNLNEYIGTGWGTNGDSAVVRAFSQISGIAQASPSASKIEIVSSSGMGTTLENWYALGVPVNIGVIGSLGMAFDMHNRGSFRYVPETDSVTLDWAATGNNDAVAAVRELNNRIAHASGSLPGLGTLVPDVNASFTAHPLGGAVLGKATDNYGRVNGYSGLYVMDGAMVNGSTGAVNPSLTISALAERNIERILAEDF